MSKLRVYIKPSKIVDSIEINDINIVHKLRNVLRCTEGDELLVFNGEGKEYMYQIVRLFKKSIVIARKVLVKEKAIGSVKITLAFPLTKEASVDFILQKATELGVTNFIPFTSERSIKLKLSEGRVKRWEKIIIEASRQSERLWLPVIGKISEFKKVIKTNVKIKLAGSIEGKCLSEVLDLKSSEVLIIVGPEGDFSPQEYKELESNNFKFVRLSSNILRVETAGILFVGLVKQFLNHES